MGKYLPVGGRCTPATVELELLVHLMKKTTALCLSGIALLLVSGCSSSSKTSTARQVGVIDTIGDSQNKGYVEFYTKSAKGLIPIYLIDQDNHLRPLAAVGVPTGGKYVNRNGMRASERLRVAAPSGTHRFSAGGEVIQVQVQPEKVTPVELDFETIDDADAYLVYRLDHTVRDPITAPEAVGGAPRSE